MKERAYEQIVIQEVRPCVEGGRHPVKRIVGEKAVVEATVFRHGHERLRAVLRWRAPGDKKPREAPMERINPGLDLWRGEFTLEQVGRYRFTVAGWTDSFASWVEEFRKRVEAHQPDAQTEIAEGQVMVERVLKRLRGDDRKNVAALLERLRSADGPHHALAVVSDEQALSLMARVAPREDEASWEPELAVVADRERARFSAWYELFVRSQGRHPDQPGTFADAERRLPDIRRMGFDVVYLAPIHPIGHTDRKGPNNRLGAGPNDPGSPWAIGSDAGGHAAIEPALGTLADFDRFVAAARSLDMEVALDFAVQCSPDHPWVKEHPEWFYRRPDGSIRFAENPPKKYQDIYPLNFDTEAWRSLWDEIRDVVLFWVDHGVKIFRVDNPHTKPIGFWTWLTDSVQEKHPDVLFLAEAFTRPPMMKALGKRGFTQSYTYFTWRNTKAELTEYLTELTATDMADFYRPNFFCNTPDILHAYLQQGGPPAFKIRLVLAATLSPSYGIYSGFELCENLAVPGTEEYQDSEKYQIRTRDWDAPGNIKDYVTRVNAMRRENLALQAFTNLTFLTTDNEQLLAYGKTSADGTNAILVVVNVDPHHPHHGTVVVPPAALGLTEGASFDVVDLVTGERFEWGERNYVRLDPQVQPAHVLRVERP